MYSLCGCTARAENLEIICACMCHAHFAIVLQRFVHVAIVNNYVCAGGNDEELQCKSAGKYTYMLG